MKQRFSETQIIGFLREADAGVAVKELCRRHGFSDASYYLWRRKFGGLEVSDAKRLKALEQENARLKKLLAEAVLVTFPPKTRPLAWKCTCAVTRPANVDQSRPEDLAWA
mgnify:CR=1 FL=1